MMLRGVTATDWADRALHPLDAKKINSALKVTCQQVSLSLNVIFMKNADLKENF
jgi:hypothetical protein